MGKVIESPVKEFPGTVEIFQPVPYPEFITWEKKIAESDEALQLVIKGDPKYTQGEAEYLTWKAIAGMVQNWNIEKFDISKPSADPRVSVMQLMAWLVREIGKVINGDVDAKK